MAVDAAKAGLPPSPPDRAPPLSGVPWDVAQDAMAAHDAVAPSRQLPTFRPPSQELSLEHAATSTVTISSRVAQTSAAPSIDRGSLIVVDAPTGPVTNRSDTCSMPGRACASAALQADWQ